MRRVTSDRTPFGYTPVGPKSAHRNGRGAVTAGIGYHEQQRAWKNDEHAEP